MLSFASIDSLDMALRSAAEAREKHFHLEW